MSRFARGECSDAERRQACEEIRKKPHLVRHVADKLKPTKRSSPPKAGK